MDVEEQHREETDVQRRIGRLQAARLFFIPMPLFGAVFAAVALGEGNIRATVLFAMSAACAAILCAYWTASIRRLKRPVAAGEPERQLTHAEAVAEAVESLRQRQWAAVMDRAYLAAGGTARRPRSAEAPVTPPKTVAVRPAAPRPDSGAVELDPRWEWQLVRGLGVPDRWVKARCRHLEVEAVKSLAGEVVAQLCLTCDTQFPAPREP
jgi:hypothetical protein